MSFQSTVLAIACAAIGPVVSGCASQNALRMSIAERDAEIRDLRAEKVALKEQLDKLSYDHDQLEFALSDAASRIDDSIEVTEASMPSLEDYAELERTGITATRRGTDIVFTIPTAVTFPSGRSNLSDAGKQALRILAQRLKADFPVDTFFVEGHTDSDPIKKSKFASNRELSLARAMAVLNFLVVECQVKDERFVVVGHGQYNPVLANETTEGKAKNRRVEVIVRR